MTNINIEIKHKTDDLINFISDVSKHADIERTALGFLPESAYNNAAEQGNLIIAVARTKDREVYAGHLLFGGAYPWRRIFQIYVTPPFCKDGVGKLLIQKIVKQAEASNYLSLIAKVATDLREANAFYEKMGFAFIRSKVGGTARNRMINLRVRDLDTPNLLNLMGAANYDTPDFHLVEQLMARAPLYVIDLNVLFDVVKKRLRSEDAGKVFSAGLKNLINFAVTEEFIVELQRTSISSSPDPVLVMAKQFPRLECPPKNVLENTTDELAHLVFRERAQRDCLTVQDKSDLRHLATAIYHKTAGFVTSEKAILRVRKKVQSTYGIDIVSVREFAEVVDQSIKQNIKVLNANLRESHVQVLEVRDGEDEAKAKRLLEEMHIPQRTQREALYVGPSTELRRRMLFVADGDVVAYASWTMPVGPQPKLDMFICTDEDHPTAKIAVNLFIDRICADSWKVSPAQIRLHQIPGHKITRRIAISRGFCPKSGDHHSGSQLYKISIGYPVDTTNWAKVRERLKVLAGVILPETLPALISSDQPISIESPAGKMMRIRMRDVENLLSPVLFLFETRNSAIVPIRKNFAEELLSASPQMRLLPISGASLLTKRTYFKNARSESVLKEGTLMLFYESQKYGGRGSIIAVARSVRSDRILKEEVDHEIKKRGVLEDKTIKKVSVGKHVLAITFDNIMVFNKPIGFERLKQLGCVDGTNLVTAQQISQEQLLKIIEEGQVHA